MAAFAFLHQVKDGASPGGFALFRIGFGLWLASHFAVLAPWAPDLLSADGLLPDPASELGGVGGLLPNPLAWIGAPWFSVLWCLLGAGLALLLAAGWQRVPVSLALWLVWVAIVDRNVLLAGAASSALSLLLLLLALVPDGEPWRWRGRAVAPRDWALPAGVFFAAWALLALGHAASGLAKLGDPSWLEGGALRDLLQSPIARPGWFRDVALGLPDWAQAGITWSALAAQLAFLPLCLTRRGRAWAWGALLGLQVTAMLVLDLPGLGPGLLALHAFAFDPAWFPPRARPGRRPVLFYDGECGLCNAVVRFLIREDPAAVLRFAPLQGAGGQRALKRLGLPTSDFDSILFLPDLDAEHGYLRTRGVVGVLDTLGGVWRVPAWALWLVPAPLRDLGYKLVARLRHALFGPYVPTPLPDPRWAERFCAEA